MKRCLITLFSLFQHESLTLPPLSEYDYHIFKDFKGWNFPLDYLLDLRARHACLQGDPLRQFREPNATFKPPPGCSNLFD